MEPDTNPRCQHTPDGLYWWNGHTWVRAWSDDLRHWYDGTEWIPRRFPRSPALLRRGDLVLAVIWILFALPLAGFSMQAAHHNADPSNEPTWAIWTLASLGAAALLLIPVTGYVAGAAPRRVPRMLAATGLIWAILMMLYSLAMLASSDPNGDIAAGAGLVLLAIPAAIAVSVLVGIGALIRMLVERRRRQ